jgi:hypothetical protein
MDSQEQTFIKCEGCDKNSTKRKESLVLPYCGEKFYKIHNICDECRLCMWCGRINNNKRCICESGFP